MHNVALTWQQSAVLTAVIVAAAVLLHYGPQRTRRLAPLAREGALIAGLYSVWQLAGQLSVVGTGGALSRARWIERVEHDVGLPSERSFQHLITGHSTITQAANYYYATMHFGMLFVFLLWLWFRHRDRYRPIRRVLALSTLACLLIQLVPVAPPRMLGGFVDTAQQYGQSVYSLGFDADQLSAMPSVHVAWAVLIAVAVVRVGSGPWRWLGTVHAAVTIFVVVATANHFWLDGIVAVVVLAVCYELERGGTWLAHGIQRRIGGPSKRRSELSESDEASILA